MSMNEFQKAKAWRESHNLTPQQLGELIGYSKEAVWAMERGEATASHNLEKRPVDPKVFRRYKCACAGLDAWLKDQRQFDW